MKPLKVRITVKKEEAGQKIVDLIALKTNLSKQIIKDVMIKGGCHLKKLIHKSSTRQRRASYEVFEKDYIEFYYDPKIINLPEATGIELIEENKFYGIWYKPAGVLAQGNDYSDHTSILRFLEKSKKEVYLIHRLDREVSGLMLFAYDKKTAAYFNKMLQDKK